MAHFKQLKPQLLSQENGILHVGRGSTTDNKDFGVVGEYNGTYAGFVRSNTDKAFHLFDSLTASPYGADAVNLADQSYKAATLALGTLNGSKVSITNGGINTTIDDSGVNSAGAVVGSSLQAGTITIQNDTISTTDANGNLTLAPNGTGQVIIGVNPSVQNSVATKSYVDSVVAGLDVKQSVRAYATADIITGSVLAGTDATKTITAAAPGAIPAASFDGVTLAVGDRVLVNIDTGAAGAGDLTNGIYTVTALGDAGTPWTLTRAADANTDDNLTAGSFTFISEGTQYGDTGWVLSTPDPITVDTTALKFTQFSSAGVIYATNVGSGSDLFKGQQGENLQFRSLTTKSTTNTALAVETSLSTDGNSVNINFDQSKITGTGTLTSGSIAYTDASSNISTVATVHGGTSVTSGGGITATNDITTQTGAVKGASVSATAGDVTASGNVSTSTGTVSGANVTASQTVQGASVTATTGNVSATQGNVTAGGDITTTTGTVSGSTVKTSTGGVSLNASTATFAAGGGLALAANSATALTIGATGTPILTFDTTTGSPQVTLSNGQLVLPATAPTSDNQAVSKTYVDTAVANAEVMGYSEGSGQAIYDATASSGRNVYFKSLAVSNAASSALSINGNTTGTVTVAFDQSQITGTGALDSGSITANFGTINTGSDITGANITAATGGTVKGPTVQTSDGTVSLTSNTLAFGAGSTITLGAASATALTIAQGTTTFATFDTTDNTVTFAQEVLLPAVNTAAGASGSQAVTKTYVDSAITNATININELDSSANAYNIYQSTTSSDNGPTLNLRALLLNDVTTPGSGQTHNTANPLEAVQTTNDITFNFDQTLIKTVGALAAGSITGDFGDITTTNGINGKTLSSTETITLGTHLLFGTSTNYLDATGNFHFGTGTTGQKWNIYDADGTTSLFNVAQGGAVATKNQTLDNGSGLATLVELKTKDNGAGTVDIKNNALTFTDTGSNEAGITYATDFTIGDASGSSMFFTNTDVTTDIPLVVGSGLRYNVKTITANTPVDDSAFVWRVDATAGNVTVTLPPVADPKSKGRSYRFIRVDNSANTITVTPSGSDLLDGSVDNFALQSQYDHADVMCDGASSWYMF